MSDIKEKLENEYNLQFPDWLNESYMENVLQRYQKDASLKVNSIKISQCGGVGDSYASVMYRVLVEVHLQDKNITHTSYIVKALPLHELAKEKLGQYNVQTKEMDIYQRIIPQFKQTLKSIKEDGNIFPKAIAIDHQKEVIVLEDLVEKKFVMADRIQQLDNAHTKLTLQKMAKMHAASIVSHSKDATVFNKFDMGMFNRKIEAFHCFFETNFEALVNEVSEWPGYSYYAKKLRNMQENLCKNAIRAFDCDDGDLHVLIHGDLWTNNIMFKYNDKNEPIDVILLDFQFCCYASPAIDLLYFIHTSCIDDLRQNRLEELIQFYYYHLMNILNKLNHDTKNIPTLHQFQQEVFKKFFYAIPSTLVILPIMIANDEDAAFENMHSRTERALAFKKRIYKNPQFQRIAKQMLPKLDQKGLLDALIN